MLRAFAKRRLFSARGAQKRGAANSASGRDVGSIFAPGEPVTYAGVTIHKPPKFEYWVAEIMGAQLWFWLLYRGYHDWEVFWNGLPAKLEKELAAEGWDPEASDD